MKTNKKQHLTPIPPVDGPEPTLVIPDVHLRLAKLKTLLKAWDRRGPVVFLGDFFDDFDDSVRGNVEMAEYLRDVLLPDKNNTVLVGNHDMNYHPLSGPDFWCSGFSYDKREAIGEVLGLEDFDKFHWSTAVGKTLFTHAGLHPRMIPPFSTGGAGELSKWIAQTCDRAVSGGDGTEPLLGAGHRRGGHQSFGGITWMDAREYSHIDGLPQIFGHTILSHPTPLGPSEECSWCLDTNLRHVAVFLPGKDLDILDVENDLDLIRESFSEYAKKGHSQSLSHPTKTGAHQKIRTEGHSI